jgi:hypothetical protein
MSYWSFKENFESGEKKIEHNINEKDETTNNLYMLLIGYVIIICFGISFHIFFYNIIPTEIFKLSIITITVFPLVLFTYYIFYEIKLVREHISYERLLEEIQLEIEQENRISEVIPVILFGIGIVYGNLQKITQKQNLLKIVAPYLLFSLLFGTVIPNIISYLIFDHTNLGRMITASDYDFIFISIAFGLMITTLLIPLLILYK